MAVTVKYQIPKSFHYAAHLNKVPFMENLMLRNSGKEDLQKLTVHIFSEPVIFKEVCLTVELLSAGKIMELEEPEFSYVPDELANFTEGIEGKVTVEVLLGDTALCKKETALKLQPFDENSNWSADKTLTAAFVTPNHPMIAPILSKVSQIQGGKGAGYGLSGYLLQSKEKVKIMAECLFQAIQSLDISYVISKPGYFNGYQRIRLVNNIIKEKQGNCMDMTLLFASCMEAMGLHPLIAVTQNHAFCGVWLSEETLPQPTSEDITFFRKKTAKGNQDILFMECTLACRQNGTVSFQSAVESTEKELYKKQSYFCVLDIQRAREGGIVPVPAIVSGEGLSMVDDNCTGQVKPVSFSYPTVDDGEEPPKFSAIQKDERWKRKLLDLSARSPLLNIPLTAAGKKAVFLLTVDLRKFYHMVKSGKAFRIIGRPQDFAASNRSQELFERANGVSACQNVILSSLDQGILHSDGTDDTVAKTLSSIRSAENELNSQGGVSALYLAFGMLRWQDDKRKKPYYAPLILVPVQFTREGRVFKVSYTGDKIQFNETVLEHLRNKFQLRPAGLSPIPEGSDGHPDLGAVLSYLRKGLEAEPGLDVFEYACLGMFQFGQYMMWKDLEEHLDQYKKHPLIEALLKDVLPKSVNENLQKVDPDTLFLPLPADGTQLEAVSAAMGGESYVLHGPPGTGKSQTIAVILSNLLGSGKTVIFAAEKAPALHVVYNRLRLIGLAPFCLYLPTVNKKKSEKELFLQQLSQALSMGREGSDTGYQELSEEIRKKSREINEKVRLLHAVRVCGFTAYNLMSEYIRLEEYRPDFTLRDDFIDTLTQEQIFIYEEKLQQLVKSGQHAGHPHGHPLRDWGPYEYRAFMGDKLRPVLENYRKCLMLVSRQKEELERATGWTLGSEREELSDLDRYTRQEKILEKIPEVLLAHPHPVKALSLWISLKRYDNMKEQILSQCQEEFLQLPLEQKYKEWCSLVYDGSWQGKIRLQNMKKQLTPFLKGSGWDDNKITRFLNQASQFQKIPDPPAFPVELQMELTEAVELEGFLKRTFTSEEDLKKASQNRPDHAARELIGKMPEAVKLLIRCSQMMEEAVHTDLPLWHQGKKSLEEAMKDADRWMDGLDKLREWSEYQEAKKICQSYGLTPFIELYENGLPHEDLLPSFRAGVYYALLNRIYYQNEDVRQFAGYHFLDLIENFKKLSKERYEVSAREIQMRLSERIYQAVTKGDHEIQRQITSLKKMIESNGKGMTVRSMMDEIPELLRILTPCRMLSPMTAAQCLDSNGEQADVLIFDEASQLQTPKSIGLIARARQVIIAGDPNQMPPTSFFDVTAEDDSVEALAEDQESILKDFLALSLPSYYLQWHYRSRHESLISFSNNRYYGSKMVTFPSSDNRVSRVHFRKVDGIYDRGHSMTNRIEAETCVAYLKEQLLSGDERSYGIITFNERQKELMERLVEKEAAGCPEMEEALQIMEEKGEPLFVRNLESVQGDERDVILFSIGYGPDKDGKITMTFGPLSLAGGFRRLNVAITRSRDEMILFSSMEPEQMKTTATTGRAVNDLKDFLKFARDGAETLGDRETEALRDGFQQKICEFLNQEGYQFDEHVGSSRLRVDIGILDPEDPGKYILGLVLNNNRYYQNPSVYDREIGQFDMLKSRGWNLLRIWSIDWWDDSTREKNRILKNLPPIQTPKDSVIE